MFDLKAIQQYEQRIELNEKVSDEVTMFQEILADAEPRMDVQRLRRMEELNAAYIQRN
jgi:hypothetical protein